MRSHDQSTLPSRRGDAFRDVTRRDIRTGWRALRAAKGFSVTVIATLALGIGAAATIFSVVDHVLLRSLPYGDADRLVSLYQRGKGGDRRLVSNPTLQDWARDASGALSGIAWIRGDGLALERPDGPQRVGTGFVSAGFFTLMGKAPALGRTFAAEEEKSGGPDVVVISDNLWRKTFSGDPTIIGRTLRFDSASVVVIGVMPPGFAYPQWADAWRPIAVLAGRDPVIDRRDFHADSRAIGRLAPGVDVAHAQRVLSTIQSRIATEFAKDEGDYVAVDAVPLQTEIVGSSRTAILGLGGAVALILLVACVNLANLASVRGTSRGREVAIRFALGASRAQVVRQLAVESATLAVMGGGLGVVLAWRAISWLRATAPFNLPRASELALDGRAVAVAAATTLMTAIVFGVLPAFRAAMTGGSFRALLGSRSNAGGSRSESRGRAVLTAAQFTLAVLLLVGAGLLAQSYRRVLGAQLGFDPHGLYVTSGSPPREKNVDPAVALATYERIVDRLKAAPGVEDAAVVNFMPTGQAGVPTRIEVPGRSRTSVDLATYITVSEGFLHTLRIPVVRGRWYTPAEMRTPGDGIVISEAVARRYWPGESAIGHRVFAFTVVGVVAPVKQADVTEAQAQGAVYFPFNWRVDRVFFLVTRTAQSAESFGTTMSRVVRGLDPDLPADGIRSMDARVSDSLVARRSPALLAAIFAGVALLLAAIGTYGVLSYAVAQRRREIGVRLALGAQPKQIAGAYLSRGLRLLAAGLVLGLAGTWLMGRALERVLFAVAPLDAVALISTTAVIAVVSFAASVLPARRAARIDPMIALAAE